jgi:hypothetical protein
MIPYDDLVAALSAWRSRQGLPVNQAAGSGSGPNATSGSGPNKAGSGPNKAPPVPPSSSRPNMPVAAAEEPMEVADELLDDEAAYENEGNDFAMAFGQGQAPAADATAIGGAPERPTETDMGDNKDDW